MSMSPLLALPAELREQIYDCAFFPNEEPIKLLQINKWPFNGAPKDPHRPIFYRMGLAQTCKQLRAEVLPIYLRNVKIQVCWRDLNDFQEAFYEPQTLATLSPRNLSIGICDRQPIAQGIDCLPILRARALVPGVFEFYFYCDNNHGSNGRIGRRNFQNIVGACTAINKVLCSDYEPWVDELKRGTFASVNIVDSTFVPARVMGLGFSASPKTAFHVDKIRVVKVLDELPMRFNCYH